MTNAWVKIKVKKYNRDLYDNENTHLQDKAFFEISTTQSKDWKQTKRAFDYKSSKIESV